MSITGQTHGGNPGHTSGQEIDKAIRGQASKEFAVWKAAGFPKDQRAVTVDGQVQLRTLHPKETTRFENVFI